MSEKKIFYNKYEMDKSHIYEYNVYMKEINDCIKKL